MSFHNVTWVVGFPKELALGLGGFGQVFFTALGVFDGVDSRGLLETLLSRKSSSHCLNTGKSLSSLLINEEQREQHLFDSPYSGAPIKPNNANLSDILNVFFDKNMSVECPYVEGPSSLMFNLHKRQ